MSWVERMLEERLAQAARDGELAVPHLEGKPLPDLDQQRPQGWWADQFARRELSHDRRQRAEAQVALARAGFWKAGTLDELRNRVTDANAAIDAANLNLVESDRIPLFDPTDIESRWRALRTPSDT